MSNSQKLARNGDWFLTFTGKRFYPIDPRPEDIFIEDIAHALGFICRFGGHCHTHYSVAQHSLLVSRLIEMKYEDRAMQFQGLMHDATEAYVGDMIRPLKVSMPEYRVFEKRVWDAVCERFGVAKFMSAAVKWADNTALMTERRDLCTQTDDYWGLEEDYPPDFRVIKPMQPGEAMDAFMERFHQLHKAQSPTL